MQAYSQDLRERVLRALARGDRPTEIARRFEVSRVWVYQVRDRERETGVRSSFQIGGHRRSRLAEIDALWNKIGELLNTLSSAECANYFASSGYVCTYIRTYLEQAQM